MARWNMSGAPAADLRQALREKAAGHSSFYRKLAAAATTTTNDHHHHHHPKPDRMEERPRSRDSAVDLDEPPPKEDPTTPPAPVGSSINQDDPYDKREYCEEHHCYHVRSKTILEAQFDDEDDVVVDDPFEESVTFRDATTRRTSTFSWDGDEASRVRKVRTPSVVVSDYSDDIHAGITVEELEYFRSHLGENESGGQIAPGSPSSGRSSCSNLDSRCGSQLSVLDLDDNSRCGSHLSVLDLIDNATTSHTANSTPSVSDCDDDDSGVEKQPPPKKKIDDVDDLTR